MNINCKRNPLLLLLCLFSIIQFNACSTIDRNNLETLPNNFHKAAFSLDDIAEELRIIPMEFNGLGIYRDIQYQAPYFCISTTDGSRINAVRFISQDGKEIGCLDKPGRGPGEYVSVYEFGFDSDNSMYINTRNKIVVYDKNLKHLRNISWPDGVDMAEMHLHNDHIYLFDKSTGLRTDGQTPIFDWIVMDTLGNIVSHKEYQAYPRVPYPERYPLLIFFQNETIYRYRAIDDTIFSIQPNGWELGYTYNREFADGYRMYSQEELSTKYANNWKRPIALSQEHIRNISGIWGFGDDLLITYDNKYDRKLRSETVWVRKSVDNVKAELIHEIDFHRDDPYAYYKGIPNDWVGYGALQPVGMAEMDSATYIMSVMEAYNFKQMVKSDEFVNSKPKRPELKRQYQELADTLGSEPDPILFLLKLK